MHIEFFCPMRLPKTTSQAKKINTATGSVFDSNGLKDAKATYESHLAKYAPKKPLCGALGIEFIFCYEAKPPHLVGEPYTQKPDWDNAAKVLQDVLAKLNFLKDDKQIVQARVTQVYTSSDKQGVYVRLSQLEKRQAIP